MRIKRMDLSSTEVQKSMRKKQHAKRKVFTDSHSVKERKCYLMRLGKKVLLMRLGKNVLLMRLGKNVLLMRLGKNVLLMRLGKKVLLMRLGNINCDLQLFLFGFG